MVTEAYTKTRRAMGVTTETLSGFVGHSVITAATYSAKKGIHRRSCCRHDIFELSFCFVRWLSVEPLLTPLRFSLNRLKLVQHENESKCQVKISTSTLLGFMLFNSYLTLQTPSLALQFLGYQFEVPGWAMIRRPHARCHYSGHLVSEIPVAPICHHCRPHYGSSSL